uniref:Dendritic cell-specific transmembrane protein-like domain-containing protein n=1 Tax=Setaria digitata TaxID=48799 RepID=A0A915Q0R5_9BILA
MYSLLNLENSHSAMFSGCCRGRRRGRTMYTVTGSSIITTHTSQPDDVYEFRSSPESDRLFCLSVVLLLQTIISPRHRMSNAGFNFVKSYYTMDLTTAPTSECLSPAIKVLALEKLKLVRENFSGSFRKLTLPIILKTGSAGDMERELSESPNLKRQRSSQVETISAVSFTSTAVSSQTSGVIQEGISILERDEALDAMSNVSDPTDEKADATVGRKVPPLRISLPRTPTEDGVAVVNAADDVTAVTTNNVRRNTRSTKSFTRRHQSPEQSISSVCDESIQRVTRSKLRQSGRQLRDHPTISYEASVKRKSTSWRRSSTTAASPMPIVSLTTSDELTTSGNDNGDRADAEESSHLEAATLKEDENTLLALSLMKKNSYEGFREFRSVIEERWAKDAVEEIMVPENPPNFNNYMIVQGNYTSTSSLSVPLLEEKTDVLFTEKLTAKLCVLHSEQQEKRRSMQFYQQVERERLRMQAESEVLRMLARKANECRECFSAMRVIRETNLFNTGFLEVKPNKLPIMNVSEVKLKYEKLAEIMRKRQQMEADALYAEQVFVWNAAIRKSEDPTLLSLKNAEMHSPAFTLRGYAKMILHAYKYPHRAVVGFLVGEKQKSCNSSIAAGAACESLLFNDDELVNHSVNEISYCEIYQNGNELICTDAIPVLHESASLSMALEAALICTDDSIKDGRVLAGLYFCNESLSDNSLDQYAVRVAEKIVSNYPNTFLVQIDNSLLGTGSLKPAIRVYNLDSKLWKTKRFTILNEEKVLPVVSNAVQTKLYLEIMDFENHLDNPINDHWNTALNEKLEQSLYKNACREIRKIIARIIKLLLVQSASKELFESVQFLTSTRSLKFPIKSLKACYGRGKTMLNDTTVLFQNFKMLINVLRKSKQRALKKLGELQFIAENCRRSVDGERLLVDKHKEFWMKCGAVFPLLYPNPKPFPRNSYERMFADGTRENDLLRIVLSFLICEFVGMLFFISIALKYSVFPSRLGVYVGIVVQCILGLMISFPYLRAVILIAVIKLITSRLRSLILMFIILWTFQISGINTTRNLQMLAESVACVSDSAIQIGNKLIDDVNMQTNKFTLSGLKEESRFFTKHFKDFRDTINKLQNVVVKFGKQAKDYLVQLLTVKDHCQRFFIGPYYFCLRIFDGSARYCDRLTLYRGVSTCKFVKDMKMVVLSGLGLFSICDAARFNELVCVIPEKLKESLKSGFLTFTNDKMKAAMSSIINDYNISFLAKEAKAAKKSWEELGISMNHSMERNRTQMFQALLYVIKYNQKEKADNVYITEEFRNVDMMREAHGQPSLLPLLPKEREMYIEGFTLHMTSKEKLKVLFGIAITLIGGFLPTFLILLDIFTYQMLYFTYSFLQSNSTRTDRLDFYNIKAAGEGFVAKLLQRILHIFHPITGRQHNDDHWRQCFTEPNPPDFQLIRLMMFLYFIAFLLCIIQVYVVRFRHLIAQYYWPERIKPRTLWLYNQLLEGRKNILSQMVKATRKKKFGEQLAEDEITGRGNLVNRGLPILGIDQYRCIRCFRPDLCITDTSNSRICLNCYNLYCTDCYAVKKKCLKCDASLQAVLNETEFYIDSSCEEDESIAENIGTDIIVMRESTLITSLRLLRVVRF